YFFFSSRRRHTRFSRDWSSDVCSSDLKGSRARAPSHPGRVLLRFEKNPGLDVGEPRFGCRSTALGAKGSRTSAPSHPGRVLLRCGESCGLDVGAPPSVRKASQARTPSHPARVLLPFARDPRFGRRRVPVLAVLLR